MAEKRRPVLQMDTAELRGMEVLQELDEFLDEEECEYDREYVESCVSLLIPNLGQGCAECRRAATPTLAAVSNGHAECLQEIVHASTQAELDLRSVMGNENGASLSHIAARRGELDCLRVLLGADRGLCEVGDSRGTTPLHVCANHGHVECLRCLLCEGRCGLRRNQDGATAIHFAAASGRTECLKVLIEEGGGDPNEQTDSGETPVYFAAQEGHLDCVHYLVESAKANPHTPSTDGMTPLHAAAQTGRLHVTHWLVRSAKCSLTSRTCDGGTPVHFAAAKGQVGILEWMLHHSLATGLEKDDFGATPIHDAADQNQLECLHAFYTHSVNLEPRDNEGMTPLDLAQEKQHFRCVQFLMSPKQSYEQSRRKSFDVKNAELRMLVSSETKSSTSKRRKVSSFLSRRKSNVSSLGRKKS